MEDIYKNTKLLPLKEQSVIAEILTTADKEIDLLEQKKEEMQVLLTSKKRLVEN